ncbi:hypothetical protein ACIQNU_42175 [Streptomyces sp. NPDC091292]|uniref:hypothetical protein n=1 Tax=Streptomyces sp. NPDC091292 TaxID=3365991 RepID=UPI00381A3430
MSAPLSAANVQDACTVLSSRALIRLITEIDDNGPIPTSGVARTLADLALASLRETVVLAHDLGLVRVRPGAGLDLTTSGSEVADIYDANARWARHHAYPAPVCDFATRVQQTLALLAQVPTAESPSGATSLKDLARPRDLLEQWLNANPQAAQLAAA